MSPASLNIQKIPPGPLRPYSRYRFFFPQQRQVPHARVSHRHATAAGCKHTKWHERMKLIKGKNDQDRRDGLRAAFGISLGFSLTPSPSDPSPSPPPPPSPSLYLPFCLVVWYTYSERSTCTAMHAARRVHAQVCLCVCLCVCVQFVKWNLNNTRAGEKDPAVESEFAYDKVFKIYSINRRWIRSSRSPTRMSNFLLGKVLRHVCVRRYLRHFTRTRMNWEVKTFYEHLAFTIIIMSAATN